MSTPRARRVRRRLRRPSTVAALVTVVFVLALFLWTRGLSGSGAVVVPAPTGPGATPVAEGPGTAAAPGATGSATSGSTVPSRGLGTLPPDTAYHFTPGPHIVTVIATGDLGTVGYIFKGMTKQVTLHDVRSPFRMTRRISGTTDLAAVGVQVYYSGTSATCAVYVDGTRILGYTAHGPYRVVGCIV